MTSRAIFRQSLGTAALFACGDALAQTVYEPRLLKSSNSDSATPSSFNPKRTLMMAGYGLTVAGPSTYMWYRFLDASVRTGSALKTLFTRVALDQLLFAPCFIAVFFAGTTTLNRQLSIQQQQQKSYTLPPLHQAIGDKLRSEYWTALMANYRVWPFIQLANFYFVPLHYRLAVVNTVAIGWNGYLSLLSSSSSSSSS